MWVKSKTVLFPFLLLIVIAPCLAGCNVSSDAYSGNPKVDPFYPDRVVTVRFVMTEENWTYLKEHASEKPYVKADMWYDGELLPDIAVRPKGNSSLSSTIGSRSIKFGLKADLNFFNSESNLDGVKKLNFNNGWGDPTFMYEILSYELFQQMGIPTPRTSFVDVYLNDIHLGLYTMVEQIDQNFLAQYFVNTTGNLYKPSGPEGYLNWTEEDLSEAEKAAINDVSNINLGGGNLNQILKALGLYTAPEEESGTGYLEQMGLKTNENKPNYTALFRLLDILNNELDETFVTEIEKVLDVDQVLRYLAVSAVLVHLDNYIGSGRNYYLYEVNGYFTIIPWDLNMSFGHFNVGLDRDSIINFLIDEPTSGAIAERPLVARLLAVPEYLDKYHEYISEMIDGPFSSEVMNSRIDEITEMIRPYVKADTNKFFSYQSFESLIGEGMTSIVGPRGITLRVFIGLKSFIVERIESIKKQLSGELPSTNNGEGNERR
jgi:spore coat protein H